MHTVPPSNSLVSSQGETTPSPSAKTTLTAFLWYMRLLSPAIRAVAWLITKHCYNLLRSLKIWSFSWILWTFSGIVPLLASQINYNTAVAIPADKHVRKFWNLELNLEIWNLELHRQVTNYGFERKIHITKDSSAPICFTLVHIYRHMYEYTHYNSVFQRAQLWLGTN